MPGEISINTNSFGSMSSLADVLIIEVSESSLQFCEWHLVENRPSFTAYYSTKAGLEMSLTEHFLNAVKHFQFNKKNYKEVLINFTDKNFTLCPVGFYKLESARDILEFNVGPVGSKIVLTEELNQGIQFIYAVDENLKSILDKLYPQHQLKHSLTVLSKLFLNEEEFLQENVFMNIQADFVEILVKANGKLQLVNQYSAKTEEDMLYYLLFILEQYQFDPLSVRVTLAGNIEANNPLISLIKKYIKQVRLAKGNKTINWSLVTGMPQHFNYTVLNRLFCE